MGSWNFGKILEKGAKKQMKKLGIAISMMLLFTLVFPGWLVSADTGVSTGVTVSSGGGNIPIVKAKWETDDPVVMESGDPSHVLFKPGAPSNSQFNPPMVKGGKKTISFYAVVTDAEDMGSVYEVFAFVYHPVNSPAPYNASTSPNGPLFKYKVVFTKLGHTASEIALVNGANAAKLITYNTGFNVAEITGANGEMTKGTADLWKGEALIDYEQPAGEYDVRVTAVDKNNNPSSPLVNTFTYVAQAGVQVDFTGIVYGGVNLGVDKLVPGDWIWSSPAALAGEGQINKATVRNIGNTWAHVTVQQNDMGFGFAGSGPGTNITSTSFAGIAGSNWNVIFDVRLGSDDINRRWYDPFVKVTTPNYLGLSTKEELDFSICVKNGFGTHAGTMTIGATIEPFGIAGAGSPIGQPSPISDGP